MSNKNPNLLSRILYPQQQPSTRNRQAANIFICFAAEDEEFARFLDQELRKRRRISGIDWEKQHSATDSSMSAMSQIDGAETFLFIISPASIKSDICIAQLHHAIKLRKIVVPLLRVDIDDASLPPNLSDLSSIDFRQTVNFEKAFEQTIAAVNTNLRIDVFICYSRNDNEFVQRLYKGLEQDGRHVWMDVSSIPTSTIWEQEIYSGIEAADNFAFVISPSSVRPESFCNKELAHAVANNKRVIPLLYRSVPDASIPPLLAQFERQEFADGDFGNRFAAFLAVLDEDPIFLREHTRLLTRAKEWQRSKGTKDSPDKSLLLRGNDLVRAEQMLTNSAGKKANFTNLQTEYVVASRAASNRSRQRLLVAAGAAVVLMAALSILLFFQRQTANTAKFEAQKANFEAQKEQAIAENERRGAQAKEQEAIAAAKRADDAAKLAQAAQGIAEGKKREADHERQVAEEARETAEIRGLRAEAGRQELSNKPTEAFTLWRAVQNLETKTGRGSIPELERVAHQIVLGHVLDLQSYGAVAASSSGQRIAIASPSGIIRVFETGNGTTREFKAYERDIRRLEFSPTDDRLLISVGSDEAGSPGKDYLGSVVKAWDIQHQIHGRTLGKIEWLGSDVLKLSPDGKKAAVGLSIFDLTTDTSIQLQVSEPYKHGTYDLAFSPDSTKLVATFATFEPQINEYFAAIFDSSTAKPLVQLQQIEQRPRDFEFSPGGRYLAAFPMNGQLKVWETQTGQLIPIPATQLEKDRMVSQFAFAPPASSESTILVVVTHRFGSDYKLSVLDLRFPDRQPEELRGNSDSVASIAFSPDGTTFAAGSYDRTITVWNTKSWQHIHTLYGHQGPVDKMVFINPHHLISISQDRTVRLWNMSDSLLPGTLPEGRSLEVISPDGKLIAVSSDYQRGQPETTKWEIHEVQSAGGQAMESKQSVKLVSELEGRTQVASLGRFSSDGGRLIAIQKDNTAYVWDTHSGKLLSKLAGYSDDDFWAGVVVAATKFTRIANFNRRHVRVKDVERDQLVLQIDLVQPKNLWEQDTTIQNVALSQDGNWLAVNYQRSGVMGEIVELRRLNAREQTAPKQTVTNAKSLAFTNDSRFLLIGGHDAALRVWDVKSLEPMPPLLVHRGEIKQIVCAPEGPIFATVSADNSVVVWNSTNFKNLPPIERGNGLSDVILSKDGSRMMTITYKDLPPPDSFAQVIRVWDTNTGNIIDTLDFDDGVNPLPAFLEGRPRAIVPRLSNLTLNGYTSDFYIWLTEPFAETSTSVAGSLTNLRVCRESNKVVAVLPYPDPNTVWAPSEFCGNNRSTEH